MQSQVQTYTTEGLLPADRIEFWNDCIGHFITSIETTAADTNAYHSWLNVTDCGAVTMVDATSQPACNSHAKRFVTSGTERMFILHVQKNGESVSSQDGRDALLTSGDFTLCDTARRFDVSFTEPHRILVVCIPEKELLRRLPNVEDLMCIRMPAESGINAVVGSLITRFWDMCGQGLDQRMRDRISENLLDLLATSYSTVHSRAVAESSLTASRRLLIKEFIEQNLVNDDLTPSMIARRFGYTTSYIHQLFKGENESISHYIIRRRVEEACKALADRSFDGRTIGEIAYSWGFNSLSHFGRAFKSRVGTTPTEFRHARRRRDGGFDTTTSPLLFE